MVTSQRKSHRTPSAHVGARQRLLRFDECVSVTLCVQLKAHRPQQVRVRSSRKKPTGRRPMRSRTEKKYFVNTDTKKTTVPRNESTIHKRKNCTEGSGTQRPQGEDPRAPGRKGDIIVITTNDWMLEKKRRGRRRPASSKTATSLK